jgi:polysaccharide deacetylase family protein (PEP-CTERM system associated)
MINALSVDVEEHFQVHAFEDVVDRSAWGEYASRVVPNTRHVLCLLNECDTRATFYILGWVAERYPNLVKEIASAGHEIAIHGYAHELIYRQNPDEFAHDLQRTIEVIRSADGGTALQGYRAPSFSITRESLWALDVLQECGIRYDSSIFPLFAHDRYGISDADRFAYRVRGGLWELPISTVRIAGRNWPVGGGGYFRLLPLWVTRWAIRRINTEGHPSVFYFHPWELDPDQPRIPNAPLLSRLRHYINLDKTEGRIRALLEEFEFAPMREVFADKLEMT